MGIATALRMERSSNPIRGFDALSGISNFFSMEKERELSLRSNISVFNSQLTDFELQYETNIIKPKLVSWDISFEKTETQNGILATEEYNGFQPLEIADITVTYQKDSVLFSKVLKILILQKIAYNKFYPEPYLIICPELELEGIGRSKDDALADICNLFDIYFNETRKISISPQDHLEIIEAKINILSGWKNDFYQLYKDLQKKDGIALGNLVHRISIEE